MDATDRRIINQLQGGFPIVDEPFAAAANGLGLGEAELIRRLQRLLDDNTLSRFGPLYHAERLGGGLSLAAMAVPDNDFERVAAQVNALPEIAHNYARDHRLNMWFVIATETAADIDRVVQHIENSTGYRVYNMPKQEEFYVGLRFQV